MPILSMSLLFVKSHEDWLGAQNVNVWQTMLWSIKSKINLVANDGKYL